jgi:hypothetical protein
LTSPESQNERRTDGLTLVERHESLSPPVGFRPVVSDVADHADNSPQTDKPDRSSNRISPRKVLPGRCLVDDHDGFTSLAVVVRKEVPLEQRHPDRPKVVG